ncbi:MAG TPA: dihydropteroate synthase [Casimicrobiaceae bacterium]|nr:dihydropteroate synthase [Casimicrobiaceae bacterium]
MRSRPSRLLAGRHVLDLARARVMGILNVTPDSFSDGGRFEDVARALDHARAMLADGADIVDVGGESTRPGAAAVDEATEIARVLPVVEALAREGALVSVDTMKPAVMRAALAAGAAMVNDVRALQAPGALEAVAASGAAVCLMHMRGTPASMQQAPEYGDVVAEVRDFLGARAQACEDAGIARERIVVDPGFGFGKTRAHNLELLDRLGEFATLGYPVLAGWSRKSTLGAITGRGEEERLAASVAAAVLAVERGASIVRVHDVRETVDAVAVAQAVATSRRERGMQR